MPARVFVIDRDESSRLEARAAIAAAGLELAGESASSGSVAALAAYSVAPDALLVGMDSTPAALQSLTSAAAHLPGTPVVVYSRVVDLDAESLARKSGADAYMTLPLEAPSLRTTIDAAVDTRAAAPAPALSEEATESTTGDVIAVYASKGGSGNTTLALNLAIGIKLASHQSVALLAAPGHQGDLPLMMELDARTSLGTLVDALGGDPATDVRGFMTRHGSGVEVLPASPGGLEGVTVAPHSFELAIDAVRRAYDYVIVDLGVMLDATTLAALRRASTVLHVVTPGMVSLSRAAQAERLMATHGVDPTTTRIVVNYIAPDRVPAEVIEDALGMPVFWTIPHDANLHRNAEMGRAIDQSPRKGGAAGAITRLARQLAGVPVENRRLLATLNMLATLGHLG